MSQKSGVTVEGLQHTVLELRNVANVVMDSARGQMRRSADRTVKRAKLYAPEDSEALMESIRVEKSYGVRGRLQIDIVVGGRTVVRESKNNPSDRRVVDLDQYVQIVHEFYDSHMSAGEETQRKREANPGVHIGSKFMTRAIEDETDGLEKKMIEVIERVITRETLNNDL